MQVRDPRHYLLALALIVERTHNSNFRVFETDGEALHGLLYER